MKEKYRITIECDRGQMMLICSMLEPFAGKVDAKIDKLESEVDE